jgi:alpha-L-rhamnosidase
LARARLYATALGLFACSINGQEVGDEVFSPGWTDYSQRVPYRTYDVTALLHPGENVLGAILGDGWYCGHVANLDRQVYGEQPKFLAQLALTYADGEMQWIASDGSWMTRSGPILESDLIMGESYDARLELPGWDRPGTLMEGWRPVRVFEVSPAALVAKVNSPVRRQEELMPLEAPREVPSWPESRWIFDLGQNMVGWVRLRVQGPAGTTVRLRYAEMLSADGELYLEALRTARATDYYTLKGGAEEVYEPRFTFHGFRYVELSAYPGRPGRDAVTGIVAHSDIPARGEFECSDPLINQLQHNIVWGQKGNFVEVPTDCPQRDERLGWTGDAQVFIRTATFNRDVAAFFTKWQQDFADAQGPRGEYPPVVPAVKPFGLTNDGGPAWADAGIICPWTIYLAYGDQEILARFYDSMARFLNYLRETAVDHIRVHPYAVAQGEFPGFGDWLSINAVTPPDLIGTAYFAYCAQIMARVADLLGKAEDAQVYHTLWGEIKAAFVRRYVTADGLVAGLTQTGYILGLAFDLLPEALRERAIDEIVRDVEQRGDHLSTGFVGTPYLLQALTQAGRLDVAYRLLMQKSWPSWLYPVTVGATTVWERWDGYTAERGFQSASMNSFNHYAYGAVGAWLYSVVAGIDLDEAEPGYRHILFHPRPGGGLTWARATHESMYGRVESAWQQSEDGFHWTVRVPGGCHATAVLPVGPGQQALESERPLEQADGVSVLSRTESNLTLRLESGLYRLRVI